MNRPRNLFAVAQCAFVVALVASPKVSRAETTADTGATAPPAQTSETPAEKKAKYALPFAMR
ncbi:MAG: hypothetical protein ACXWUG_24460, partial [Polyangiales bacterium]